jgi:hypothetical protein
MNEYGKQKDLTEILQELVNYCANNTAHKVELQLKLPKTIFMQLSLSYRQKEAIPLGANLTKLHLNGGAVEIV